MKRSVIHQRIISLFHKIEENEKGSLTAMKYLSSFTVINIFHYGYTQI